MARVAAFACDLRLLRFLAFLVRGKGRAAVLGAPTPVEKEVWYTHVSAVQWERIREGSGRVTVASGCEKKAV